MGAGHYLLRFLVSSLRSKNLLLEEMRKLELDFQQPILAAEVAN